MNRSLLAVMVLAIGGATSVSYAQDNSSGFYVGAGVGQFNVNIDDIDQTDNAIEKLDDDDAAWKAFVGYRINPYIALEAAYIDFGTPNSRSSASGSSGDYRVGISGFAPTSSARFRSVQWNSLARWATTFTTSICAPTSTIRSSPTSTPARATKICYTVSA